MGLGTNYPAAPTNAPKPPTGNGYNGGGKPTGVPSFNTSGNPPSANTGSRAYSQAYPDSYPSWYEPGRVTPSGIQLSPYEQAMQDFSAINKAQGDMLMSQYLGAMGLGQAGYDNETWYRNAQAANDLARLGLGEQRDVGLARQRNAADREFAGRAFDLDSTDNSLTRDMRYRANDSEAAGRGSITSFGYGQNNRDILGQYGIAQGRSQLAYDKKMSDLALDDKAIDTIASEYGLKRDDINNALKYGLTQLGLDWTQTVDQLNRNLQSGDLALQQNAINFMTQIMSLPMDSVSISDLNLNLDGGAPAGQLQLGPASLDYLASQTGAGGGGSGSGSSSGSGNGGGGGPQRVLFM